MPERVEVEKCFKCRVLFDCVSQIKRIKSLDNVGKVRRIESWSHHGHTKGIDVVAEWSAMFKEGRYWRRPTPHKWVIDAVTAVRES